MKKESIEKASGVLLWVLIAAFLLLLVSLAFNESPMPGERIVWKAAALVFTVCFAGILMICYFTKRKTGRLPKELTEAQGMPLPQFVVFASSLIWYCLHYLGEIKFLRPAMAFSFPGIDIAIIWVWFILPSDWRRIEKGSARRWMGTLLGFAFCSGFIYLPFYLSFDHIVAGFAPLIVWGVAVVEAIVLIPLFSRFVAQIYEPFREEVSETNNQQPC